jgi:hypothetical protein
MRQKGTLTPTSQPPNLLTQTCKASVTAKKHIQVQVRMTQQHDVSDGLNLHLKPPNVATPTRKVVKASEDPC